MKVKTALARVQKVLDYHEIVDNKSVTLERSSEGLTIKKAGLTFPFPYLQMRPYQSAVRDAIINQGYQWCYLMWPRRAGKEVLTWHLLIESAIRTPGVYMMIYPLQEEGRNVIWYGDISLPGGKQLKFLDMIPYPVVVKRNHTEMKIIIQGENGTSVLMVGGSNADPDKYRGMNPRGVVLSEFAYQNLRMYKAMRPVIQQNGGWMLLQTTPAGFDEAWHLFERAKGSDHWFWSHGSVETCLDEQGNRYITDEDIEEDRQAGMTDAEIEREYYCIVRADTDRYILGGRMQALYEQGRIQSNTIRPHRPVFTAWDLGNSDKTSIVLFQMDGPIKPVIIHHIEDNDQSHMHYIDQIHRFCNKHALRLRKHFLPHDGKARKGYDNLSYQDALAKEGELSVVTDRPDNKLYAIRMIHDLLPHCIIDSQCDWLITCLKESKKEYNKRAESDNRFDEFTHRIVHDKFSHAVDAFQTMAIAIKSGEVPVSIGKPVQNYDVSGY